MENFANKRINVLVVIFLILTLCFGYRLFSKQIVEHAGYLAQAQNQYIVKQDLPATRGKIYANDMYPLATNTRDYAVNVVPRQIPDKEKQNVAEKLASVIDLSSEEIFNKINNDKYYIPPLVKHLTEEQGDEIAQKKIKGVTVVPENIRFYPEGQLASQILGFVDASGEGKYGLEGYYNEELKGISGEIFGSKDTRGRIFDIGSKVTAHDGESLILSLDRNIQYQAENILSKSVEKYEADSGSMIVMEPKTGKILAIANSPTFDPNAYNKVKAEDQWLFNNPAISSAWEPGSIFKPLIMAAAIQEGKIQPETKNTFGASVQVDGYKIETSTQEAYGEETMTQVLENSDNVAMVWISELLGKDTMFEYIKDFGFGRKSGVELDTESSGDVADPKKWSNAQRATISFGQGITATPLQILAATSAIANEGNLMKPYIVEKIINANKEDVREPKQITQVLKADTAKKMTEMLVSVVVNGHGKRAAVEGYDVAGKTGTAQVPKPGGGYYKDRHIGSFVGFAPADNPKFSMLVRLNNPKNVEWAESSAAPTFGEMAKWLLDYLHVPAKAN